MSKPNGLCPALPYRQCAALHGWILNHTRSVPPASVCAHYGAAFHVGMAVVVGGARLEGHQRLSCVDLVGTLDLGYFRRRARPLPLRCHCRPYSAGLAGNSSGRRHVATGLVCKATDGRGSLGLGLPRRVFADRVWRGPKWSSIHGWYSVSAYCRNKYSRLRPRGHSESVVFEQFEPVQPPDNAGPLAR
jgi:hypothetical protein